MHPPNPPYKSPAADLLHLYQILKLSDKKSFKAPCSKTAFSARTSHSTRTSHSNRKKKRQKEEASLLLANSPLSFKLAPLLKFSA